MQHHYRDEGITVGSLVGHANHLQYKMRDKSPLEVFSDHTSHVALEDMTRADLGCDDLSNDSVKRSRFAACNTGV